MAIAIVCTGCSAKLNAPDTAAGKKIKCPKCQAVCSVPAPAAPAFEAVEDAEPTPKAAKPTAKAVVTDEEDDRPRARKKAEDDDNERPRDRKRKRDEEKTGGSSKLLIGLAAVVLLAGGGFAAYWFGFRDKSGGGGDGTNTVSTENWETYTSPGNVFKASFPGKPEGGEWKPPGGQKVFSDIRTHRTGEQNVQKPSSSFFAGYVRFPEGVRPAEITDAKKWLVTLHAAPATYGGVSGGGKGIARTMAGREWEEFQMTSGNSTGVVRWHQAGPILYMAGYRCENQKPSQDAVEKFFASFEVLGGDPGDPDPDSVKLDGWETYTAPDNTFKASFPGAPKKKEDYSFGGGRTGEFREYTAKDEKTGKSRTYFAGSVHFAKKPTYKEVKDVKDFVQSQALGGTSTNTGQSRLSLGGWPFGEERRLELDKSGFGGGNNGIVRWVEAGPALYAAGIKSTGRFPSNKEIEQFFGAFEILDAKPGKSDLAMPPDWAEYRQPNGEFRAAMPRQVHRQDDPFKQGNKPAGSAIASLSQYTGYDLQVELVVYVVRFAPEAAEADRQKALEWLTKMGQPVVGGAPKPEAANKITWGGRDALEHTYSPADVRAVRETHDASVGYVAVAYAKSGKLDADIARAFLDSFSFDKGSGTPPKTDTPTEWAAFKPAGGGFEASMPPKVQTLNFGIPAAQKDVTASIKTYRATDANHVFTVHVIRFAPGAPEADRQKAANTWTISTVLVPRLKTKREAQNKVTWAGKDAVESTYSPPNVCVARQAAVGDTIFFASVSAETGTLDPEKVQKFLDSFAFDKE